MDLFPLSLVLLANLVLHSPLSLRSHHQPHLVAADVTTEFTTTWEVTNSDGSVSTESGIVSESGSSFTITTSPTTNLI